MKIALIGSRGIPATYGGIERGIEEVATRLVKKGHDVTVYCWKGISYYDKPTYKGVNLIKIPTLTFSKHLGNELHSFFSTIHALTQNYDAIRYHALGPGLMSIIPRIFGKKTLVSVHGLDWQRKKWGLVSRLFLKMCEHAAVRFPNDTVVVSNSLKEYFKNKYGKEPIFIPNGVNKPSIRKPAEIKRWGLKKGNYILFLGRLEPEKGIKYLIEAYENLKTNKKLVIAGEGEELKNLKTKNKNIVFTGFVKGKIKEELISNAYLFVLPSEIEGMSNSLLEAMSYGICCVTSDIRENLELESKGGFYFKNKDRLDLYNVLKRLVKRQALVKKTGLKAKKYVQKHHSWDRIVKINDKVYKSIKS